MSEQPQTGKINRTPAEASLHLPLADLLWLRDQWLSTRKVADVTRVGYEGKTRPFVLWWTEHGASYDWRLTPRNMALFETWLGQQNGQYSKKPLTYTTKKEVIMLLRLMFKWA